MIVRGMSSFAFIPLTHIPLPKWIDWRQEKSVFISLLEIQMLTQLFIQAAPKLFPPRL
jgi:hypothetical protein